MGMLKHVGSSSLNILCAETTVGRSTRCSLLLSSGLASSIHARIRWSPLGWELRDLGSTNGTFLNGVRLRGVETRILSIGDQLAFGAVENRYEVVEVGAPVLSAFSNYGEVVCADGPMLVLPSGDNPLVTIYRSANAVWQMEGTSGAVMAIEGDGRFCALGKFWTLVVPDDAVRTLADAADVRQTSIHFFVSADEERVRLVLQKAGQEVPIESRAFNYLLLTLARRRLRDIDAGFVQEEAGWMPLDELAHALATSSEHVNVDVYRVRKRLGAIFCNAAEIIERRTGTGQLRIGVQAIEITRTAPKASSVRGAGAELAE